MTGFGIVVALDTSDDKDGKAFGELFWDDGETIGKNTKNFTSEFLQNMIRLNKSRTSNMSNVWYTWWPRIKFFT